MSMTIDRAREIVDSAAELGPNPARLYEAIQALCVVVRACGMKELSDDQFRDHLQKVVEKVGAGKC